MSLKKLNDEKTKQTVDRSTQAALQCGSEGAFPTVANRKRFITILKSTVKGRSSVKSLMCWLKTPAKENFLSHTTPVFGRSPV